MRRLTLVLALTAALGLVPSAAAWTWPLAGDVLRPYSLGPDAYAAGQHRGVDVGGAPGEPVRAPASGTVSFTGVVPGSGRTVTIQLDGYAVSLTHLGEISIAKGTTVAEGQAIGVAGQSGDAEWPTPYVHLGIRVSAAADGYVDPATLLPPRAVAQPPAAVVPVAAPVVTPVAAPVVTPIVAPVAAPAPIVPPAVQVSAPDPAPGTSLPPAPSPGGSPVAGPSPVAGASHEPVPVEAPPVRNVDQPTVAPSITPRVAPNTVRETPGGSSTVHRPSAGTTSVADQPEQHASLDRGSPPVALPEAGAGGSADARSDIPDAGNGAVTPAVSGSARNAAMGSDVAVSARRNPPRGEGAALGVADEAGTTFEERVERVTPADDRHSGVRNLARQALAATAREATTSTDTVSLLQRGQRWVITVPALLLVAFGTIWLLVCIRRLDRDGVLLRYGRGRLGRHAGVIVAPPSPASDRGRLA